MTDSRLAPAQQLQLAVHFHSHGQLDNARALYESLLQQAPRDFTVLYHLGMLEMQTGDVDAAVRHFSGAVEANPNDGDAQNNLAFALQQLGRFDEAANAFARASALKPTDVDVAINRGVLYKQREQWAEALAVFDDALRTAPQHAALLTNRGNVLQGMGRLEDALQSYDQALAVAQDHPVVLSNRASVLCELGRYADALVSAERATLRHPKHAQAWVEQGAALKLLDRTAEAVSCFEKAIALAPTSVTAHTALAATVLSDREDAVQRVVDTGRASLTNYLRAAYHAPNLQRAGSRVSVFRLKHDVQQAAWLQAHDQPVPGLAEFLSVGHELLDGVGGQEANTAVTVSGAQWGRLQTFWSTPWVHPIPSSLPDVLNPDNDWAALEDAYLAGRPEIVTIDHFLSAPALAAFQTFAHASRVWHGEYANAYLGAFANRGFSSPLHLQLARELKTRMPRVFKDYLLTQLWGFKYEPSLSRGINVHADFAKVNLNFWIAPDAYNLDANSGGLKVYDVPAPADWTFEQYNTDSARIYAFLEQHGAREVTVPHRCNRAVLFNSALFHETDAIHFEDRYEGRRVNMTYLFGQQLR